MDDARHDAAEAGAGAGRPALPRLSRRRLMTSAATLAGLYAFQRTVGTTFAQSDTGSPGCPLPGLEVNVPDDPTKEQGLRFTEVGIRSPFVNDLQRRWSDGGPNTAGSSWTPHQDLDGIITPADLHFQRNHAGTAIIDPSRHRLVIHGMVDRPKVYTVEDIQRFPRESHIYFVECSGNSGSGYGGAADDATAQSIHGLTSTSEWVGVPVRTLLEDVGAQSDASWALFEGSDAAVMDRSVPVEKLMDDALIAYMQNGEPIRPEQGYPMRLVLPGWEGNAQIKWLRRIELGSAPFQTKEETRHYTDSMPDGTSRQFTFVMEAKSIITWPSGGQRIAGPGFWEIKGIAWSGRGRIRAVEVSTDNGSTWNEARLDTVFPIAHTRFRYPWQWDGERTTIMSRAIDETGYVQPTREELVNVRGTDYVYHFNGIQPWVVANDGSVTNGLTA
ncbi:MAG: sulfite dehydrogenase [Dehalococcoidia bacterium]